MSLTDDISVLCLESLYKESPQAEKDRIAVSELLSSRKNDKNRSGSYGPKEGEIKHFSHNSGWVTRASVEEDVPLGTFVNPMPKHIVQRDGFFWSNWSQTSSTDYPTANWEYLPCIWAAKRIACKALALEPADVHITRCAVPKFDEHEYIRAFKLEVSGKDGEDRSYTLRVCLPVDPSLRTLSEVATIRFVQKHTNMPVPTIVAFDATTKNELGLEWILAEVTVGIPISSPECWTSMSVAQKEKAVLQIANWDAQFFNQDWSSDKPTMQIGSLFEVPSTTTGSRKRKTNGQNHSQFAIGPLVKRRVFQSRRLEHPKTRAAFATTYEWLDMKLNLLTADTEIRKAETLALHPPTAFKDLDDALEQDTNRRLDIKELQFLLPYLCSPSKREITMLCPSYDGILVDPVTKEICSVPEWDCTAIVPVWNAGVPNFLYDAAEDDACEIQSLLALYTSEFNRMATRWFDDNTEDGADAEADGWNQQQVQHERSARDKNAVMAMRCEESYITTFMHCIDCLERTGSLNDCGQSWDFLARARASLRELRRQSKSAVEKRIVEWEDRHKVLVDKTRSWEFRSLVMEVFEGKARGFAGFVHLPPHEEQGSLYDSDEEGEGDGEEEEGEGAEEEEKEEEEEGKESEVGIARWKTSGDRISVLIGLCCLLYSIWSVL